MLLPWLQHRPALPSSAFVAPGAILIGDVSCGERCSFWYNCVLRGDVQPVRIGERVNIQDLCMIHATTGRTPTEIGDDVTVGHRALLHGCRVGRGSMIGMGAILLDDVEIGEGCIVGAGALVTARTRVPPGVLVMGSPAKVVRQLRDEEAVAIAASAHHYAEMAELHRQSLQGVSS